MCDDALSIGTQELWRCLGFEQALGSTIAKRLVLLVCWDESIFSWRFGCGRETREP